MPAKQDDSSLENSQVLRVNIDQGAVVVTALRNVADLSDEHVLDDIQHVRQQLDQTGIKNVVFSFGDIDHFGSAMLEVILIIWKAIKDGGGRLALCSIPPSCVSVLEISRFDTFSTLCNSLDEAIRAVAD